MCGLVGVLSSDMLTRHRKAMDVLLYLDALRGEEATGVAAVRSTREVEVFKNSVASWDFLQDKRYDKLGNFNDIVWIGHNRSATIGAKNRSNAHPFIVEDNDGDLVLVGAHNGTLKNKHQIPNGNKFDTDSEALYNHIAAVGPNEAIANADGAWSLTWWDGNHDALFMLRNKERPMHYVFEEDGRTMLWASEAWMLAIACGRAGIKIKDIQETEVDTLYRFEGPVKTKDAIEFSTEGGLVGKPPANFQVQNHWTGGQTGTQQKATSETAATGTESPGSRGGQVIPFTGSGSGTTGSGRNSNTSQEAGTSKTTSTTGSRGTLSLNSSYKPGFKGKLIPASEFNRVIGLGCAWCEYEEIKPDGAFGWLDETNVVCHKCLTGTHKSKPQVEQVVLTTELNDELPADLLPQSIINKAL